MYVDEVCTALGDLSQPVEDAAGADRLVSSAAVLRQAGFDRHHLAGPETTAYDLAWHAVKEMDASRLQQVNAIIWGTCIPDNANLSPRARFQASRDVKDLMSYPASRLQADLGLHGIPVMGLTQLGCTNMLSAIRTAHGLLATEPEWSHVLCITADRFPQGALYEQAYNLISDGAAAWFVSRRRSGYRVIGAHHVTNGALVEADDDETVGSYFSQTKNVVTQLLAAAGLRSGDVDWVVPQNTDIRAWQILCRLLDIPNERVAMATVAQVGHVISSDNLFNLRALERSGRLCPGHVLLLVMAGYGMHWAAVLLERV